MEGTRRFIGVVCDCCHVYIRLYLNRQGTAYVGTCPKCQQPVTVMVGQEPQSSRVHRAY